MAEKGVLMRYDGKDRRSGVDSKAFLAVWGLCAGVIGGLIGGLIAFSAINYWTRIATVGATDAVSIANTYIVYTTFVMAAVAAGLTLAGLMFSQHFAIDRETHIAHAFESLIEMLGSDERKAIAAAKQLVNHPDVVRFLEESLKDRVDAEIKRRASMAKNNLASAQDVHDAAEQMNSGLSS